MKSITEYQGKLLNHVEALYRPGERELAVELAEALGCAKREPRTEVAERLVWGTHDGPQFHQSLIKTSAPLGAAARGDIRFLDEGRGCCPKLLVDSLRFRISRESKKASEDTDDISIKNWLWLIEGDRSDGSSGVRANAWKIEEIGQGPRKATVSSHANFASSLLEITGTGIVAEAFPEF